MKNQIEVPRSALSLKDFATGKEVLPEKGDPVDFRIEGTIRRVEAGYCLVDVKFVNGQRPGPPEANDEEGTPYGVAQHEFIPPEESGEEASLRAMAQAADQGQAY